VIENLSHDNNNEALNKIRTQDLRGLLAREIEKEGLTTSPERPYTEVTIRPSLDYYFSTVYHGK
jgi:hypothetical protein